MNTHVMALTTGHGKVMVLPIVFFDFAGTDTRKPSGQYLNVFGLTRDQSGNASVPVASPPVGRTAAGASSRSSGKARTEGESSLQVLWRLCERRADFKLHYHGHPKSHARMQALRGDRKCCYACRP